MKNLKRLLSPLKLIKNHKISSIFLSAKLLVSSYSKPQFLNLKIKKWLSLSILIVPPLIGIYLIFDFFTETENLKGLRHKATVLDIEASRRSNIKQNEQKWIDHLSSTTQIRSLQVHFPDLEFKVHETRKAKKIVERELGFEKPQLLKSEEIGRLLAFLEEPLKKDSPQYIIKSFDFEKRFNGKREPVYYLNIDLIERSGNE